MTKLYEPEAFTTPDLNPEMRKLYDYLKRELDKLANVLDHNSVVNFEEQFVAIAKPQEGDVVFADGTSWNPGSGMGLYAYLSGGWRNLSLGLGNAQFTPTLTGVANVQAVTNRGTPAYVRLGDRVLCFGGINLDPTAGATPTSFSMTLPVASNLANDNELAGTFCSSSGDTAGRIRGDTSGDLALFENTPTSAASQAYFFSFFYRII